MNTTKDTKDTITGINEDDFRGMVVFSDFVNS